MNKEKLSEMINGIDDKYLAESEEATYQKGGSTLGKIAFFAVAALLIAAITGTVVLKLNKINNEQNAGHDETLAAKESEDTSTLYSSVVEGATAARSEDNQTLIDLVKREDGANITEFDGHDINELINDFGTPLKADNGSFAWEVELGEETRYLVAFTENNLINYMFHTVPVYVTVVDAGNGLYYHSWDKASITTSHLIFGPKNDVFGNTFEPQNGERYELQTTGTVEESLPGYISTPYAFKKIDNVSDEDFKILREAYRTYENMSLVNKYGNYSCAELAFRSLASNYAGDSMTIQASNILTMNADLFQLSINQPSLTVDNPTYTRKYIYNETNHFGFTGVYGQEETDFLIQLFGTNYEVYEIDGHKSILIFVTDNALYVYTGLTPGLYKFEKK